MNKELFELLMSESLSAFELAENITHSNYKDITYYKEYDNLFVDMEFYDLDYPDLLKHFRYIYNIGGTRLLKMEEYVPSICKWVTYNDIEDRLKKISKEQGIDLKEARRIFKLITQRD